MAETPETIVNAAQMKAKHPGLTPSHLEAFADPEIFAKQFWNHVIAANHEHDKSICAEVSDGHSSRWFPENSYRYAPREDAPTGNALHLTQRLRWSEFMRGLYKLLNRNEWERVVLRFGPYSEKDFLVVEISPDGLTPAHWQAACELARTIATRPEPPASTEKTVIRPF